MPPPTSESSLSMDEAAIAVADAEGEIDSITEWIAMVWPPFSSAWSNWTARTDSWLALLCARTSVTWPTRRLPLGITAPPEVRAVWVVLTTTASPTFADLESRLPTSSPLTGRISTDPAVAPFAEASAEPGAPCAWAEPEAAPCA